MRNLVVGVMFVAAVLAPAAVSAQSMDKANWFVAPFLGSSGGSDLASSSPSVGLTGGWIGSGWFGAEADLAWAPEFFEQDSFLSRRRMFTLMGNGIVRLPGGESFRPYSSAGLGLLRPTLAEAGELVVVDTNKLGWNAGAGATFAQGRMGVRGDVRYFRGLGTSDIDANAFGIDFSKLGFWRLSVGLDVKF